MSFSLKQCFTHCSISPKGEKLGKESLVQIWIGLGLISCCGENQSLEDIGYEHIETLTWISFLQEEKVVDFYKNETWVTMHDLAYDLAKSIAGEECFVVQKGKKESIPDRLRHLCLFGESIALEDLPNKSNLRTLLLYSSSSVENIFSSFKFLRVLGLVLNSNTENLPTSICKLRHLRVLEIYSLGNNITVTLPKSIMKLQRLQTLVFYGPITVKELPRNLHLLSELRHIILRRGASASYSHMPSGLGQLTSIQTLSVFVVGKGKGCKLNELNGLKRLRGKLMIKNLENVKSTGESAKANLKDNPNLEEMELVWNEQEVEAGREDIHVDVLETLQPHQHLKRLSINGYKGDMFPTWLMADPPLLTNLVKVSFKMGGKCKRLPPFGELQSLEFLELVEFLDLQCIDVERTNRVRGGRHQNFPKLKELKLANFHNLKSWATTEEESIAGSLPCLVNLTISSCPKLTAMPLLPSLETCELEECSEKLVHSMLQQQLIARNNPNPSSSHSSSSSALEKGTLKYLAIIACKDLVCLSNQMLQGCSSLLELKITDCECLTTLSGLWHLRALEKLKLCSCKELRILEGTDRLSSLQKIPIESIPNLVSIPEGLRRATTLCDFSIQNAEGLMDLPEWLGNLTSLQGLHLVGCKNLKMTRPNGLRNLQSLRSLAICPSSSLMFCPEDIQYLSTALLELFVVSFEDLPKWLGSFTSLQTLSIVTCPNLECLPGWMSRLTALQELHIFSCDHLTSRCQKFKGVDWPVIAHIPTIFIDKVLIQ